MYRKRSSQNAVWEPSGNSENQESKRREQLERILSSILYQSEMTAGYDESSYATDGNADMKFQIGVVSESSHRSNTQNLRGRRKEESQKQKIKGLRFGERSGERETN